jgi:hypothetical protein
MCFPLLWSALICFDVLCFALFYFALLFYSILLCSVQHCSALFCSVLPCSVLCYAFALNSSSSPYWYSNCRELLVWFSVDSVSIICLEMQWRTSVSFTSQRVLHICKQLGAKSGTRTFRGTDFTLESPNLRTHIDPIHPWNNDCHPTFIATVEPNQCNVERTCEYVRADLASCRTDCYSKKHWFRFYDERKKRSAHA